MQLHQQTYGNGTEGQMQVGSETHDVERIPANRQRTREIVDQAVNCGLVLEQLWVLIVDAPAARQGRVSGVRWVWDKAQTSW